MSGLLQVQKTLGIKSSGTWDGSTRGAVLAYQQSGKAQYPMDPNGHPDPATLVNLGYYAPPDVFTDDWSAYLSGGTKPGHFGRDLRTSIDQVPRWTWFTLAGVFGAFAYIAWKREKKRS